MQPQSARARIGDVGRSAAGYAALSPRSRELESIRVTTPATTFPEAAKPAARDAPPAAKPAAGGAPPAVKSTAPVAAEDPANLKCATCIMTCLRNS